MTLPVLDDATLRLTDAIYYGQVPIASVPLTRVINTTAPLTGGGDLSADLTLGITMSPVGSTTAVGITRTITATAPLLIDLAAFQDLSADRTLSILPYTGAQDGYVVKPGAVTGLFYRDDGSWQAVAGGTGVPNTRLINTTAPLTGGGDLSADRTLGVNTFTSVTAGAVPASGGGTINFLRADQTWAPTGVGAFVRLQNTHPGTPDTGNTNISGWSEAAHFTNSDALSTRNAATLGIAQFEAQSAFDGIAVEGYGTVNVPPTYALRRGRGTAAVPSGVSLGDNVGEIIVDPVPTNGTSHTPNHAIAFFAGSPQATQVPVNTRIKGGEFSDANSYHLWVSTAGAVVGKNLPTIPTSYGHAFDVRGSFGGKVTAVTTSPYVITDSDFIVNFDATLGNIVATLPAAAAGRDGRILICKRSDAKIGNVVTINTGGPAWDQGNSHELFGLDSITFFSNGAAWETVAYQPYKQHQLTAGSALNTSITNSPISNSLYTGTTTSMRGKVHGSVARLIAGGKYGTTGTPTLRFRVSLDGTNDLYLDSGTLTTPNGVSNVDWRIELEYGIKDIGLGTYAPAYMGSYVFLSDGAGVSTRYVARPASFSTNLLDHLQVWAQWGTSNLANTITCEYAYVRREAGMWGD